MLDNETVSEQKIDASSDSEAKKFLNCLENAEEVSENQDFNNCIKKAKNLFDEDDDI